MSNQEEPVIGKKVALSRVRFMARPFSAWLILLAAVPTGALGEAWTPVEISTLAWYDASDTNTITETGGIVTLWTDKGSNGIDMAASLTQGPSTGTRTINDLNVLDFDSSSTNNMADNDCCGNEFSGNFTAFMVTAIDDADNSSDSIFSYGQETARYLSFRARDTSFSGEISGSGTANFNLTGGPYEGGTNLFSVVFNATGTTCIAYVDGTSRGSSALGSLAPRHLYIYKAANNSNGPDGAVAEYILVPDVTTETRQRIEGYLAHKWGLRGQLPAGHPYRSRLPWVGARGTVIILQ